MARTIPSDLTRLALSGIHEPELETLKLLKSKLPDDFTVFHGVHWTREYKRWTHFGEIDFVVLNRSGDTLFIEQKNGALEEVDGSLTKRYRDGAKDPIDQVHRSIDKVRQKFAWRHGKDFGLHVDYVVFLPDYRVREINAVGLDATRIVDARAADTLPDRIEALLGPGVDTNHGRYDKVCGFFCQHFEVVPDIATHRDRLGQRFIRQVGPVAHLLSSLEMSPFRMRFVGSAGSGKSLLARQYLANSVAQGKRVLLTCFNRSLAEHLQGVVPTSAYVQTFHGLCVGFLESRGHKPDFERSGLDPEFWRQIPDLVTGESIPEDWLFDTLVVDEGQDFEQEWLEILNLFMRKDADLLWLEDPLQNLQGKPPVLIDGVVGYRCKTNYRTPESIARFIRETLPFEFELGNDLPGLGVGVHEYAKAGEQPRLVARIIHDLVKLGFAYEDIAIVSCLGGRRSVFNEIDQIAGIPVRRFTGEYDENGAQMLTDGKLTFDSIYRYKGQESPAVILVDIDPDSERHDSYERLLYCGMTRATIRLELVVAGENEANRRFLSR